MIEINADNNTANVFYPEKNNTVGKKGRTQQNNNKGNTNTRDQHAGYELYKLY